MKKVFTPEDAARRAQATKSVGLWQAMLVLTGQSDILLSDIDQAIFAGEVALRNAGIIAKGAACSTLDF
ncbi:hypothetical protein LCGC14_2602930 [marine sediment metagenome]|uniref:Uncharacterized protein n=1 Tax=marine sediment metagenome TaxID=412755 RepID=A0A0F9D0Z7_9ZZZZ